MTIAPDSVPGSPVDSVTFSAFRAFFESERAALEAALLRDLTTHGAHYQAMSAEQGAARVSGSIDDYLQGLADPHAMPSISEEQLVPMLAQKIQLDAALHLTSIYRQHLLDLGLRALAAQVPEAANATRALIALVDHRDSQMAQIYEDRLRIFQTLVDNSPDGIGVSGLDGKQIHPNPAFRALLGYGDELLGMHFSEYIDDEDPAVMQHLMVHGFWQGVNFYRRKDGSSIRCHSTIFLIPGANGQPRALGGVVRDITEQLRTEEELKRQADGMRTFFALAEKAPDGVLVASITGTISYANAAICTMLGYPDGMAGMQIVDQLAATPEQLADITQQMTSNGTWSGSLGYRRRDGGVVQCQASSFLVKSDSGDPSVIASIVRDVTEQQRTEQERMELQEQVIAAQQAALRELSTPLIPLANGVVAMPLIGSIDSSRAQQIVEGLLEGVAANRAMTAIIDITGVPIVDTQVAGALVRAAQAVELLGARVVLTGIRPEVAQTLVGIGMSLGSIITRSTLEDGIAYALRTRSHY